jgi:hypothetical protein
MLQHLQEMSQKRRDYIVPGKDMSAVVMGEEDPEVAFALNLAAGQPPVIYHPTRRAHESMMYRMDIPRAYYERMGTVAADLLAHNINYWTERADKNFLVRTIDDKVRAIMSDRFRILDSTELFFTTFTEAKSMGAKIVQADLTEDNFYMKVLQPDWAERLDGLKTNIKQRRERRIENGHKMYSVLEHLDEEGGQFLIPGVSIKNSDTGNGSLSADLFIFDTSCMNGMVGSRAVHKVHLGKQLEVGFLSQETRDLTDQTVWSEIRDMLRAVLGDRESFLVLVKQLQEASEEVLAEPSEAVDLVVKNFGFDEVERDNIMNELLAAGSNTVYGLLTAVTAVGRDKTNYDDGRRFEEAGGDILANPTEFIRIRRGTKERRVATK